MSAMVNDPPSYESVVASIDQKTQGLTDPKQVLEALSNISDADVAVLANNADQIPDSIPAEKRVALSHAIASTMTDDQNAQNFLDSAQQAADAAKLCQKGFMDLVPQLSAVDAMNQPPPEGPFLPRFKTLHQTYYDLITQSATLASNIATYASGFESLILPFAANGTITTDQRLAAITQWEQDATNISNQATQMKNDLFNLQTNFGAFVGTFQAWAQPKIDELNKKVKELDRQLTELNEKLTRITSALIAFGVLAAASLPVTGVVAVMSGPAAPLVIVGGLIVAGVSTAITVGLFAGKISVQNEIASTQRERDSLDGQAKALQNAQDALVKVGRTSLADVNDGLAALMGTWSSVITDCAQVKSWLAQGGNVAAVPAIMQVALENGNSVYKTMATYLYAYVDGVNSAGIKPPQYIAIPQITQLLGKHAF